jgi:hypothetical protein
LIGNEWILSENGQNSHFLFSTLFPLDPDWAPLLSLVGVHRSAISAIPTSI